MKNAKTTSIKIDPKTWEDFKVWCIKNHTSVSKKLDELVKETIRYTKYSL